MNSRFILAFAFYLATIISLCSTENPSKDGQTNSNSTKPKRPEKAILGITILDRTKAFNTYLKPDEAEPTGVILIRSVIPESAAERAGLFPGDVITHLNGIALQTEDVLEDFQQEIFHFEPGATVEFSGFKIKSELFLDGEKIDEQNRYKRLHEIIDQESYWKSVKLSKNIALNKFSILIPLASTRSDHLSSLPDSNLDLAFPELLSFDFIHFLDPLNELGLRKKEKNVADILRKQSRISLAGSCKFEAFLHQNPQEIHGALVELSSDLRVLNNLRLIQTIAKYLGIIEPKSPAKIPPVLPRNEEECVAQLAEFLAFTKEANTKILAFRDSQKRAQVFRLFKDVHHVYLGQHMGYPNMAKHLLAFEKDFNRSHVFEIGAYLIAFFSDKRLALFKKYFKGNVSKRIQLDQGIIQLGSSKSDQHTEAADIILDFGGDDTYFTMRESQRKPIIIDFSGNDSYISKVPYEIGSAFFGASYLLDLDGNDLYVGESGSIASGFGGIGVLRDRKGNDRYIARDSSIAIGLFGAGVLMDDAGNDRYISTYCSQGIGLAGGFGLLCDRKGHDHYISTGDKNSGFGEKHIYTGLSQGVGVGLRETARGGLGILFDQRGNDIYRSGNFAQGVGFFFGTGVLIDERGNDRYHCSRYGIGAAVHDASALFLDRRGNDSYVADLHGICGTAWDRSVAYFEDQKGKDHYQSHHVFSFGAADHNGIAYHLDLQGSDSYSSNFYTFQSNSYHGGISLGIFLNQGGKDSYPPQFTNNKTILKNDFVFIDE